MATIEILMERLQACEAEIATLRAEKKSSASAKPKAEKAEKVKKTSSSEGPTEWNIFVKATMKEMTAEKGVIYDSFFKEGVEAKDAEAEYKKASKLVGVIWQGAMKEASRRKDEMDGKDHAAELAAKAAKKAAAAAKKEAKGEAKPKKESKKEPKAKKAKAEAKPEAEAEKAEAEPITFEALPEDKAEDQAAMAEFAAEIAASDMEFKIVGGKRYIIDTASSEMYETTGLEIGERIGIFDEELGEIDLSA
jgi:hypothetical protein